MAGIVVLIAGRRWISKIMVDEMSTMVCIFDGPAPTRADYWNG